MVDNFSRHAVRVSVAQICQIIGWTSINSTPLEILTDILQEYIFNLSKIASNYAILYGQSEPNVNHLALAFKDMGITVTELQEFVMYVETCTVLDVPKYPIPKESHLNHLKPGSREVVTRPVHIHEHLPPMHPHLEDRDYILTKSPLSVDISTPDSLSPLSSPKSIFKKPGDPTCNEIRRGVRPFVDDNEVRPLREISSVMMTTSGFLSPAREGKLPEARTQPIEFTSRNSLLPEESNLNEQNFELKTDKKKKLKIPDVSKKLDKENKIKEENRDQKETEDELKGKKLVNFKETSKLKALKTGAQKISQQPPLPSPIQKKPKVQLSPNICQVNSILKQQKDKSPKCDKKPLSPPNKDLFIPSLPVPSRDINSDIDIKLPSEPDRQKLNIFKKITKVKEENEDSKNVITEGRDSTVFLIEQLPHIPLFSRKILNEKSNLKKECEDEMETHIDVENTSPPSIFDYNRLLTPDLPKMPELQKIPEIKKKKKEKKEKRDLEVDKDVYNNSPKNKHPSDENFGKSKLFSAPEVTIPEDPLTPAFPGLSCPVSPAPGLIPWGNPLFTNTNPTSPAMSLINYSNFPKKSQEIPSTVQQSTFSSPFTSSASHSMSGTASLASFSNKDNGLILTKKKDRKKDRKLKEKVKKKKDKKEKNRPKDKSERKKLKLEKKERAKLKLKKEKKEKKKEKELAAEERHEINVVPKITFKLGPVSPKDNSIESCTRKIVIKPIVKKEENESLETNLFASELPKPFVQSSNLKLKTFKGGKTHFQTKSEMGEKPPSFSCAPILSIPKAEPVSSITKWDGDTNQLWICPACSRPDDGSPMIACDLCDYWYHWTCVGIQEAIENDWYCESCTLRREEGGNEKKKKHRKKKTLIT